MRVIRVIVVAVAACCFASCDKDDPQPQELVTYTLEVNQDWWIFASGPDGRVLDSKQLIHNQPVSLTAKNPPDSFSITLVKVLTPFATFLDITTYTGITPGATFAPTVYDPVKNLEVPSPGNCFVKVINYPPAQLLPLLLSDPFQSVTHFDSDDPSPTFLLKTWQPQTFQFLVSAYKDDYRHPVYKYVDPAAVGETATADFNTFMPFSKTIDLKSFNVSAFARATFQLYGMPEGGPYFGYKIASVGWQYSGESPTTTIGYFDDIKTYNTILSISESLEESGPVKRNFRYVSTGPINTAIEFLHDDLTVTDESISSFEFSFTGKYQAKRLAYRYTAIDAVISWSVYSAAGSDWPIAEVPAELIEKFPDLIPSNLKYFGAAFFTSDNGYTYQKMKDDDLSISYGPDYWTYTQTFVK